MAHSQGAPAHPQTPQTEPSSAQTQAKQLCWRDRLKIESPHSQPPAVDYLLPRKTIEKLSGLSRASIYRLIKANKFPAPYRLGTGAVRWKNSDILAWQQSLTKTTTAGV